MALLIALGLLLSLYVTVGRAVPSARNEFVVKEEHPLPQGWTSVGVPDSDHRLALQIGLKQANFSALEERLWQVSYPSSPNYGQYLSKEQVEQLSVPSADTVSVVTAWLHDYGIQPENYTFSPGNDWIFLTLPVSTVETLLSTKYEVFARDGQTSVRTTKWSLPQGLVGHITTIQPTTAFLKFDSPPFSSAADSRSVKVLSASSISGAEYLYRNVTAIQSACNFSAVTPKCLRTLYNTIDYAPRAPGNNGIGIANFLGQTNNRSDIRAFLELFRPDAVAGADTFSQTSIAGGTLQQSPDNRTQLEEAIGTEGDLDAETVLGISYPTPLISYSTGGSPPFLPDIATPVDTNEPYLAWVQWLLNQTSLPPVISISYADDEQSVPYSYAQAVCRSFAQLGLRGITLISATGDHGVGAPGTCASNGKNSVRRFLPAFPASCPYLTTVGATRDFPEVVAYNPATGFASGSGFSNYFMRPAYQDGAVLPYIAGLKDSFKGLYNRSGRAYPDISAQGYHYLSVWYGRIFPADGTSAAAPTVAAILSLVNDALIASGKPTLGFLNPWLYKVGHEAFTDVVNGTSVGCNTTGFPAGPGWDVASGWGTPDFLAITNTMLGQPTENTTANARL